MSKLYFQVRQFLKKIYFQFFRPKNLKFPEMISIELTTICNAKCKFCPHSDIRRKKVMADSVFKKIINCSINHPELKLIKPFLYGEPLITPKFFEKLGYIREKLPDVKIRIVTNGSAMTKEKSDILVSKRLCDEIFFSLDTVSAKLFKEFKGLDYDQTIGNINYFLKKNNENYHKIKVIANFVATKENEGELSEFKRIWKPKVDGFHIGTEVGLNRRGDYISENTNLYCRQPFFRLNFLSDGRAVMCCADAFGEVIVGDIKKNSVEEIWNSPIFKNIRNLHLSGNKKKIKLCSGCNEWA